MHESVWREIQKAHPGKYSLDNSPITLHLANGGTMPLAGETVRDLRVGGVIVEGLL